MASVDEAIQRLKRTLKRAGSGAVVHVPAEAEEVLGETVEFLRRSTHHYSYNQGGSDYSCLLCGAVPRTNNEEIVHKDNCIAEEAIKLLTSILNQVLE